MKGLISKRFFFFLYSLMLYNSLLATNNTYLDSIQSILKKTTNTEEKLKILYTLSFEYSLINPEIGIKYGKECYSLSIQNNNLFFQLNAYNGIANSYETLGEYDSALYYHLESYKLATKMGSTSKMALTLSNIALIHKLKGDYKKALNQYLFAYKILEKQDSYNPRIHFYIGDIYMRLNDYENAELQTRLGIKKCIEYDQKEIKYNLYINLAKCYLHVGKIDSAKFHLLNSLKNLEQNSDQLSIGICLNALGEVFTASNEYDIAFKYYSRELNIQKKLKNSVGINLAYINMANSLAHTNQDKSLVLEYLKLAEKGLEPLKSINDQLLEIYLKKAETYELINNSSKALENYKLYQKLKEKVLDKKKVDQIVEMQTKYETEKKELKIRLLEQSDLIKTTQLKTQESLIFSKNILIATSGIVIILTSISVFFILQKQKLKTNLEKELAIKKAEETERLRIAKDIHDDLGSGLSKINFLSAIILNDKELSYKSTENIQTIVDSSSKIIESMRDLIWILNPENTTMLGLISRIREYASDYLEDYPAELNFNLTQNIIDFPISKESYRDVFMTVKEALNNIIKHSNARLIEIKIEISQGIFILMIKDNGKGIANLGLVNSIIIEGNGLKNMTERIESIGGKFKIESNSTIGTIILIEILIDQLKQNRILL
ncbi:MAG: hypothetical protein DWP98_00335 [Bacteroidetes bacterium]|nr:MAG: hypothetical protein DWP98_00335 [Bacteroidota bacterium]MBL1145336.1 hypothetical protein [Bacteroidota bacterium]NOG58134.1 tetratricopeptide repeat protein [Bacteroidota bacterium]